MVIKCPRLSNLDHQVAYSPELALLNPQTNAIIRFLGSPSLSEIKYVSPPTPRSKERRNINEVYQTGKEERVEHPFFCLFVCFFQAWKLTEFRLRSSQVFHLSGMETLVSTACIVVRRANCWLQKSPQFFETIKKSHSESQALP